MRLLTAIVAIALVLGLVPVAEATHPKVFVANSHCCAPAAFTAFGYPAYVPTNQVFLSAFPAPYYVPHSPSVTVIGLNGSVRTGFLNSTSIRVNRGQTTIIRQGSQRVFVLD